MNRTLARHAALTRTSMIGLLLAGLPWVAAHAAPASGTRPAVSAKSAPAAKPAADEGRALLEKVGQRYQALSSYRFEGTVRMNMLAQGQPQTVESPFRLAVVKPDRLFTQIQNPMLEFVMASDGQQTTVYLPQLKQYTRKGYTPFGGGTAADLGSALAAGTPIQRFLDPTQGLLRARVLRQETVRVGGTSRRCKVVEVAMEAPQGGPFTSVSGAMWIDPERLLVVRDSVRAAAADPNAMSLVVVADFDIATADEPVPESLFAYTPPADAKLVENLSPSGAEEPKGSPLVGKPAEGFTLSDLAGAKQSLAALKGKVVLLDFWATWCGPCRRQTPNILKLHRELGAKGLAVVAVNVAEKPAQVKSYLQKNGYDMPVWMDTDGEVAKRYGATGIPTLVVIDREGVVSSHMVGLRDESELRAALKKAGLE